MSVKAMLKRVLPASLGRQAPVCERYWEDRHRALRGSLKAPGHIKLTEQANAEQYETKKKHVLNMIRRHCLDPADSTLLDAGCGVGLLTPDFAELGFDVVGADFSATAIAQARATGVEARFVVSPLDTMDLGRRFAVITAIDVLLHVVDDRAWRDTIAALQRHLEPEGVLIILDTFSDSAVVDTPHCRTRLMESYTAALDDVGLRIIEHEQFKLPREGTTKDLFAVRHAG